MARQPRRFNLRKVADQLPTKWFGALITAGVLIATAAFGGLAKAPTPALASFQPGEEHAGEQMSVTIENLLLLESFDDLPDLIRPEPGEKVVALVATMTNNWNQPVGTERGSTVLSVSDRAITSIAPEGTDSAGSTASADDTPSFQLDSVIDAKALRTEDATMITQFQPGVPVRVAYLWIVDQETATAVATSNELTVTISDPSLYTYAIVEDEQRWSDPVPAATVKIVPEIRE